MAAKKADIQKDFTKFLDQTKDGFRKFGKELSVLAKKSEKEIVKVSKAGKIQFDIMNLTMQKEKLYYDIGKKIVSLSAKKKSDIPELAPFWNKLRKLESGARKKKRELSGFRKEKK
ncbi:MAG: hypothetical protein WBC74_00325 [Candidatus Omnitrophota bacterium]